MTHAQLPAQVSLPRSAISRIIIGALILLTFASFWGVHRNGFISYDDPDYLTANRIVQRGLTSEGLAWAFGNLHAEATYWHPLTWVSHMIDVQLFGMNPGAHHLVSVALHAANVVVLFLLLRAMTGAVWRSALVAALFALHPLQVESVSWATERKNVLSTLFWMLTLWSYVWYAAKATAGRYLLTCALFALGLMCKPALVTLPCVMLLLDFWPLRRLQMRRLTLTPSADGREGKQFPAKPWKKIVLEKAPFFGMALFSSWITVAAHQQLSMVGEGLMPPMSVYIGNILQSYLAYIRKLFLPFDLAIFYPFPMALSAGAIIASAMALLVIIALVLWRLKRLPYLAVGWFWFVGTLVPTSGIVPVGTQAMADRFMYVPIVGLLILIVWGASDLWDRLGVGWKLRAVASGLAVGACAVLTVIQVGYWRDDLTVFGHALQVTPDNYLAYVVVGHSLLQQRHSAEALDYFETAVRIQPHSADALAGLASALLAKGNCAEAIPRLQEALRFRPDWAQTHLTLGTALEACGRAGEAIQAYETALQLRPDLAAAHLKLGNVLLAHGKQKEAVPHLREAIRLQPGSAEAMARLAWILATHKDASVRSGEEALRLAEEACRLTRQQQPQFVNTLAAAYAEVGQFDQAARTAQNAMDLASARGQTNLLPVFQKLRDLYASHTPLREGAD